MKLLFLTALFAQVLMASEPLSLDEALALLKQSNLQLKAAQLETKAKAADVKGAKANNWGTLTFIQDIANSNDPGNVFGFKLASREATFGDFGAQEFMQATAENGGIPPQSAYDTPPDNLNYPASRNFFRSKLQYTLALYSGGKISAYSDIATSMQKISELEGKKLYAQKRYEIKKSFYDMAMLNDSLEKIQSIMDDIETLQNVTLAMIDEGYAKNVDLLEVRSKKANVTRIYKQLSSHKTLLYQYISFLLNTPVKAITTPSEDIAFTKIDAKSGAKVAVDIQKVDEVLNIYRRNEDIAYSSYLPTLGVMAEASSADDTFLGDFIDHSAYTVGAKLEWNLFSGGSESAREQKAHVEYLKMRKNRELAQKGIALQIEQIQTEIDNYDNELISLQKEYALQKSILQNYEARYKEQLVSMSDVIMKHTNLTQTLLALLHVKNARNERLLTLEKITYQGE